MIKSKNKKAFTLVELIIVITILAILATIAFISFQGYSKNARDGNRLSSLKNIKSGLEIYYTQVGSYPDTESGTLIQSSGGLTTIGTQGYFGDVNSRLLKFSKTPTDPYDGTKYIYSINANKNKYQILGFLETSDYLSLVNNTYAEDYSTRTPKTLGDNLGILLDSNNNPISGTGIDIENYTGSLKAIFSDSYNVSGTGIDLKVIKSTFKDGKMWKDLDKNCDLPDVVVGNQVWAGCNSTLGYGAERGQLDSDIGTNNYNSTLSAGSCRNYDGVNSGDCTFMNNKMKSNGKANLWFTGTTINGDNEVNNIWGKFYSWESLNTNCKGGDFSSSISNNNCPCPVGWHIPIKEEIYVLENNLWKELGNPIDCRNSTGWNCNGIGWKSNGLNTRKLINVLKIPLGGYRDKSGYYLYRGFHSSMWTSSKNYSILNYYNNTGTYHNYGTYGLKDKMNIRCIKD